MVEGCRWKKRKGENWSKWWCSWRGVDGGDFGVMAEVSDNVGRNIDRGL